ncbi:hypothetical protein FRB93_001323 [Tulasnella sp. JGI-2019a]|nr:hypothetical protein FRB93_001323 [Tulasnella sp. JGI-2019a]
MSPINPDLPSRAFDRVNTETLQQYDIFFLRSHTPFPIAAASPGSSNEAATSWSSVGDATVVESFDPERIPGGDWSIGDKPASSCVARRISSVEAPIETGNDGLARDPGHIYVVPPLHYYSPVPRNGTPILAPTFTPGPALVPDPILQRPQRPVHLSAKKGPVFHYCVHEDRRKCPMDAPFRKKRSVYEEVSLPFVNTSSRHWP